MNGVPQKDAPSLPDGQEPLGVEEIRDLRLEVAHLLEQQRALQHDPHSNDTGLEKEVEESPGDEVDRNHPAGDRGYLPMCTRSDGFEGAFHNFIHYDRSTPAWALIIFRTSGELQGLQRSADSLKT